MAVDSLWSSRTLFMPMDGPDSTTDGIVDVKQHAVTLVGNTQLKTAQSITGGSSCYFDGSGDRITFSASADWDMSGGNFCIEFCIRADALPTSGQFYRPFLFGTNGSTAGLQVYILDTGAIGCSTPVGGSTAVLSSAGAIAANTWARIEISCSSGSARIFKDGALIAGPTTITDPVSSSSNTLAIGYDTGAGAQFAGYIDRIRVGRAAGNTAAFTSDDNPFPRPTLSGVVLNASAAPVEKTILVVDRSSQRMLGGTTSSPSTGAYLFYPPDFGECEVKRLDEVCDPPTHEAVFSLDCRGKPGGLIHTDHFGTLVSWFGSSKIDTDGQSVRLTRSNLDRIEATPPNIRLGTHDFSIDLEFLPVSAGGTNAYARLLAIGPNDVDGSLYIIKNNNDNPMTFRFETYSGGSYQTILDYVATTVSDAWHKLQLRRTNGVLSAYVDGVLYATKACTVDFTGTTIAVGGRVNGHENFDCNIRAVRVSKGPLRGATTIPSATLLKMPTDGGSGENALIYDRVIPG